MNHALRVDLLDRPHVLRVIRPVELVPGAGAPPVERPFVVAHEVLAGQDRMLLDPDDAPARNTARTPSGRAGSFRSWRSRPRCRNTGPAGGRGRCFRTTHAGASRRPRPRRSRSPAGGLSARIFFVVAWNLLFPRARSNAWWWVSPPPLRVFRIAHGLVEVLPVACRCRRTTTGRRRWRCCSSVPLSRCRAGPCSPGGSAAPPRSRSRSATEPESPHMSRWLPSW